MFHTSRRYYSEDKAAHDAPAQEKGEKKESGKSDTNGAETTEKLKAKEAEVVDLTVSVVCAHLSFSFCSEHGYV